MGAKLAVGAKIEMNVPGSEPEKRRSLEPKGDGFERGELDLELWQSTSRQVDSGSTAEDSQLLGGQLQALPPADGSTFSRWKTVTPSQDVSTPADKIDEAQPRPLVLQQIGRFQLLERLGAGGMGQVYKALDEQSGRLVALKFLHNIDRVKLPKLKHEFRAIQGLSHPNLVRYDELRVEGDTAFLVMEFVAGQNLTAYLRSQRRDSSDPSATAAPADALPAVAVELFHQLSKAIGAIHAAGIIHCDLKPSNVLVTSDGRVVLLDFGINQSIQAVDGGSVGDNTVNDPAGFAAGRPVGGTRGYMSPEQLAALPLSPATDCFSLGLVFREVISAFKPAERSSAPGRLLEEVAEELLRLDPSRRLQALDVVARLGNYRHSKLGDSSLLGSVRQTVQPWATGTRYASEQFVGRARELAILDAAYQECRSGKAIWVEIHGASGIGKSALIEHFLESQRQSQEPALCFEGRCLERESIPFRALDDLAYRIAQYLQSRRTQADAPEATGLSGTSVRAATSLHADIGLSAAELASLTQQLPYLRVLRSQGTDSDGRSNVRESVVEHDLAGNMLVEEAAREAALLAARGFAKVVAHLSHRQTVILCIDDVQWGDVDSAELLTEMFRTSHQLGLLLITTSRTAPDDRRGFSTKLVENLGRPEIRAYCKQLPLSELGHDEACELLRSSVGPGTSEHDERVGTELARLTEQAAGHPYLLRALARQLILHGWTQSGPAYSAETSTKLLPESLTRESISLESLIRAQLKSLDPAQRKLLDTVAVAGGRAEWPLLDALTAGVPAYKRPLTEQLSRRDTRSLEAADLVRSTVDREGREVLELYHDQVRACLLGELTSVQQRELHLSLAVAGLSTGIVGPERLAEHFAQAGDSPSAAVHAAIAAERALTVHAYEQAVHWLRRLIELLPRGDASELDRRVQLAAALRSAGHRAEAASEYQAAASLTSDPTQRFRLVHSAATCLLMAGQLDTGVALLNESLPQLGVRVELSQGRALAKLIWHRLLISWRLRKFSGGSADLNNSAASNATIDQYDLRSGRTRIELAWSTGLALGSYLPLLSIEFLSRIFAILLKHPDPEYTPLVLLSEAAVAEFDGRPKFRPSAAKLLRAARRYSARFPEPPKQSDSGPDIKASQSTTDQDALKSQPRNEHEPSLRMQSRCTDFDHQIAYRLACATQKHFLAGRWRASIRALNRLEALPSRHPDQPFYLATAQRSGLMAFFYTGQYTEMRRRVCEAVERARRTDDVFALTNLRTLCSVHWLFDDQPEVARREIDEAMQPWPRNELLTQHMMEFIGRMHLALYSDDPTEAWDLCERHWRRLSRSYLMRMQYARIKFHYLRGCAAVRQAYVQPNNGAYSNALSQSITTLRREHATWARCLADALSTNSLALRENSNIALSQTVRANSVRFASLGMTIHKLAAEYQLAWLTRNDMLREAVLNQVKQLGIKQPFALLRVSYPHLVAE